MSVLCNEYMYFFLSSEFVLSSAFSLFLILGACCHIPVAENISLEVLFLGDSVCSPPYILYAINL